jgi:EthD domain
MSGPDGVPSPAADLSKADSTMYKVVAFLCRKPGLTRSEFIDYYERQHIPRILGLERQPVGYRRTYPIPHDADTAASVRADADVRVDEQREAVLPEDFDVITELEFASRADYDAWAAEAYAPASGIAADEANFLDRSRTRSYPVEQYISR